MVCLGLTVSLGMHSHDLRNRASRKRGARPNPVRSRQGMQRGREHSPQPLKRLRNSVFSTFP
ncbi:MAG: hypothetical protein FalmKO_26890 [Falsiruegeria mediterranea]